ncbi:DUF5723 family protein [Polaribacter septentrionalilitoris]|uniref:DUF5723 family protein n=1 Tax=Polaribacter septentrionalilitoris TaxID=2494657 RepID=UPI00135CE131|nr:DUF5723 family protein [Polaribacter septentrionalilitoris]
MKYFLTFILVIVGFSIYSQNKQVLYNFSELPQTLLLNPGAETNYKLHVGVPLLSGISGEFGSSGFTLSDLFLSDNRSINNKVSDVISKLNVRDHIKFHSQVEVLNGGYRFDDKTYFSFGLYEEIDGILYLPKDVIKLFMEGNSAYLNQSFSASQILYKLDFIGVLHFGVTKKINEKLTVGGRFKIYSSALNLESSNNSGTLTTANGINNIYTHYLDNININFRTSGLVDSATDKYIEDGSAYLKNTFLGSNLGVGFDFGLTYHIDKQLEFSASILDFGFIKHKKNVKTTTIEGNFIFEGIDLTFNANNGTNYWGDLDQRFRDELPTRETQETYISWRPTKLNAALKYSFGEKRSKYCYDNTYKDFYTNAIGVQLYSVFRPLSPLLALTGFYEKSFSKKIHAKVTYTIDDYSLYNIGAGISMQFGKVNFYGVVDNIAQFNDITSANNLSFQLGFNIIFN